jgi:hypothetical protein
MTNLIQGYGYLQSVAVEMPQSVRDLALNHRNSLINAIGDSSVVNQRFLDEHTHALENLRHELHSISEQRIMLSVRSRDIINQSGMKPRGRLTSTLTLLRNKDVSSDKVKSSPSIHGMTVKTVSSNPNDPIAIPSYKPPRSASYTGLGVQSSSENISGNLTGWKSGIHIPSTVRIGSLPEEVEGLVTTPVDMTTTERRYGFMISLSLMMIDRNHDLPRPMLKKSRFKRIMRDKVQKTQAQVATLRETLLETSKKWVFSA